MCVFGLSYIRALQHIKHYNTSFTIQYIKIQYRHMSSNPFERKAEGEIHKKTNNGCIQLYDDRKFSVLNSVSANLVVLTKIEKF